MAYRAMSNIYKVYLFYELMCYFSVAIYAAIYTQSYVVMLK